MCPQVHERTLQGDFLMALLKELVVARRAAGRPLKVCLFPWPIHSQHSQHAHSSLSLQPFPELQALR